MSPPRKIAGLTVLIPAFAAAAAQEVLAARSGSEAELETNNPVFSLFVCGVSENIKDVIFTKSNRSGRYSISNESRRKSGKVPTRGKGGF